MFKTLPIACALVLGLSGGAMAAHHDAHYGARSHRHHIGEVIPPDQFETGSIYAHRDEGVFSPGPVSPYLLGPCGFNILRDLSGTQHYCGR